MLKLCRIRKASISKYCQWNKTKRGTVIKDTSPDGAERKALCELQKFP